MNDLRQPTSKQASALASLWRQAARQPGRLALCLALMLLAGVLTSGRFLLMDQLLRLGFEQHLARVLPFFAATIACWLLAQFAGYVSATMGLQFERSIGVEVVERALHSMVRRQSTSLRPLGPNQAVHYLRTGLKTVGQSLRAALATLTQGVVLVFSLMAAFWLNPLLAGITTAGVALAVIVTRRHWTAQRRATTEALLGEREFHSRLSRLLEALPQLKIYAAGPEQLDFLAQSMYRQKRGEQRALLAQRRAGIETRLFASLAGLASIGVGGMLLTTGEISIAGITSLLILQQSIFMNLKQVVSSWGLAGKSGDFIEELFQFQQSEPQHPPADATRLAEPIRSIRCERASFSVGQIELLSEVDCRLVSGKMYGVVGPAGSGKSMLLHLLSVSSPVRRRELWINEIDSRDLLIGDLADRIALVTWPPLMVEGTLADNLRIALPQATDDELTAALSRAAFADDLQQLATAGGLQAPLGCQGIRLSVGQMQRLALARALLRQPDVLLIDDMLTGLDPESARHVLSSLRHYAAGRLVVVVLPQEAHADWCDEVLVMENSRVVAQVAPNKLSTIEWTAPADPGQRAA